MKFKLFMTLSLCFLGSILNAAVIHVSGSASGYAYSDFVSTSDCNRAFDAPNSGGVSCVDPLGSYDGSAGASGDRYSGVVMTQAFTEVRPVFDDQGETIDALVGQASGTAWLTYSQDFYLSGGSGFVTLNFDEVFHASTSDGESSALCTVNINGNPIGGSALAGCGGEFSTAFFAPFRLTLNLYTHAAAGAGDINFGVIVYDLSLINATQNGKAVAGAALQPVPEPASLLSVAAGLAALALYSKRRSLKRSDDGWSC